MEIRVVMNTGVLIHSFTCIKEFEATIRRYKSDADVKITVKR